MFDLLAANVPSDPDLPARAHDIDVLTRVLMGQLYDVLPHEFHDETNGAGEYVPLRQRKPSVRYPLCRLLVEDSVSLLFGEGRFPAFVSDVDGLQDALTRVMNAARAPAVFAHAAFHGSVGSVAIQMRVLSNRLFLDVLQTAYLTPEWMPEAPDTLLRVTERRKTTGRALRDAGYTIAASDLAAQFWFQRVWDAQADTWFQPWLVSDDTATPKVDAARTVTHGLGFVPLVWIRNLATGTAHIDGYCTFRPGIETNIEIDYQLSQAGRGLKYSADPTLMIREPATDSGQIVRSASNALIVSAEGDAKLLEITGGAASAVIEYVRFLRETALEAMHGNRSTPDKLAAATSGKALEMHHQALIWLADRLRHCYGDGLIQLCQMVIAAAQQVPLTVNGERVRIPSGSVALAWPAWFDATKTDRLQDAQTLATHRTAGHLSRRTAISAIANEFAIERVDDELNEIAADEAAADARSAAQGANVMAATTEPG